MLQWCGDMGVAGWLSMIALWVAVLGLAVWAVIRLFPSQPRGRTPDALDLSDSQPDAEPRREPRPAGPRPGA